MKPRNTFVCACCRSTEVEALAVDYKPHRGPSIRICASCENVLIGYGEAAGMAAIRKAAIERDTHLVQAGMLSILTPGGGRIDLTPEELRAITG